MDVKADVIQRAILGSAPDKSAHISWSPAIYFAQQQLLLPKA